MSALNISVHFSFTSILNATNPTGKNIASWEEVINMKWNNILRRYACAPAIACSREWLAAVGPVALFHWYKRWWRHSMASLTTNPSLPGRRSNNTVITMTTAQRRRRRPVDMIQRLDRIRRTKLRHWGRHWRWHHHDLTGSSLWRHRDVTRVPLWRQLDIAASVHSRVRRRTSSINFCAQKCNRCSVIGRIC